MTMNAVIRTMSKVALVLTVIAVMSKPAHADSILTLMDGTDTWTLQVQDNCTTCAVTLKVVYGAASARAGDLLQAIQWDLTDPNVTPATIGFATTNAGTTANWSFSFDNLNNNGCTGGSSNSVCGAYSPGFGFGPITDGETLTWTFNSVFSTPLPAALSTGNIRAAYNTVAGGNAGIFSPGGGDFTPVSAPEPSTVLLVGFALAGLGIVRKRIES